MKKIKIIILAIISFILLPNIVNAASGSIMVSSSSTVVKGNRVTVSVTLSSSTAIGSWQMDLNYDKSYLQLVSSTAEGGGTRMAGYTTSVDGTKSKTYTFSFKTLKAGSTRVSVSSYLAYANSDFSEIDLTSSSKNIKIMTQEELEATYSKDNNLKSLSVEGYELDKEFNKDTLEYTVNVPTGTTSVIIKASENDSASTISGDGEITVTEGLNTIPIIVTAQNGSEKTYTIIVNVEDLNPINVTVEGNVYTIIKNGSLLTVPKLFSESTIVINSIEIPALVNNAANITLVGLKNSLGNIELFIYDNDEYKKFNEMNLKSYHLIPVPFDKELDLIKSEVTINNEKIEAYKYSEESKFVVINAKSLEDGKIKLYLYDTVNKTASIFDDTLINETKETLKMYTYVIIGLAGVGLLLIVIILCLTHSLRKKQKKIKKFIAKQEAKIEATRKLNEVVDEVKKITEKEKPKIKQDTTELKEENKTKEDKVKINKIDISKDEVKKDLDKTEEIYNLFEDDKKRKKKK